MRTLGIVRRLVGCFYCGWPTRGDVCGFCSDLPLKDPLVAKARLPLSEQERIEAAKFEADEPDAMRWSLIADYLERVEAYYAREEVA